MNIPRLTRSFLYAACDILVYLVPLAIVIVTIALTGGSRYELLHLPDWWFVVVLVLFDAIRDTAEVPRKPELKGLDHRVYLSVVGGVMLLSMGMLILAVVASRKPDSLQLANWFSEGQWVLLTFALTVGLVIKAGIVYEKLKP